MNWLNLGRFASNALAKQRLRTRLCLAGVAIGVTAVVLLTALGEGARAYVRSQFESLGTNLVFVVPGKNETAGALPGLGGAPNDLTLGDAEALRRRISAGRRVVPLALGNDTVSYLERRRQVAIVGSTREFVEVRRLAIASGQSLPDIDFQRSAPVAIVGQKLARELFQGENPLGKVVRIGDWRVRVIGLLESRGVQLGMDVDDVVLVPVALANRMFNRSSLFRIIVEVGAHTEVDGVRDQIVQVLTERHGEEDITCLTQDSVSDALGDILGALTAALAGLAGISLTVAGIGIMNVMLVSVAERTGEVGLLRAVGARRGQVLFVFLAEAVLISALGGALGLLVSWLATKGIGWWFPNFPVAVPPWAAAAAILLSMAVGALFGVWPAMKATRLDPVAALSRR